MSEQSSEPDDGFYIDGVRYTPEDLTFREQREFRRTLRLIAEREDVSPFDAALSEVVPAFVFVVLSRTQPDLTVDDVLDMRLADFEPSKAEEPADPPKPARGGKRATSGTRKSQPSTA